MILLICNLKKNCFRYIKLLCYLLEYIYYMLINIILGDGLIKVGDGLIEIKGWICIVYLIL